MEEKKIAHSFLQSFTLELIKNTPVNYNIEIRDSFPEVEKTKKSSLKMLPKAEKTIDFNNNFKNNNFLNRSTPNNYKRGLSSIKQTPRIIQRKPTINSPFSRIEFLLKDPAITDIECRGANKNILVRKAGTVQVTKVILNENEIMNILNDFSTRTKIPIVSGTFKAAANNLIMTAIVSEVLGPRFVIQKRNPFNSLIPF